MTTALSQHKKHTGFKCSHATSEHFCSNPSFGLAAPTRPRLPAAPHNFNALGPSRGGWSLERLLEGVIFPETQTCAKSRPPASWSLESKDKGNVSLRRRHLQMPLCSRGDFCSCYGNSYGKATVTSINTTPISARVVHLSLILSES